MSKGDACKGKVRHTTYRLAKAAARTKKRTALVPYRCPFCKGWHVGNRGLETVQSAKKPTQETPAPTGARGLDLRPIERELDR